ncbi:protein THYLAKOID ASSEMBLY 8-like, chloroplastic [Gastrolobium bilobum]|uniref:protein THYLAKOID ASSEMBLY 8-like, chloroplastic n=1 Tax=Gastrolobium bilobum TaxID=150636 RepID=UPI002AAFE489|nr:protein THYLAKOID ASSEMBLY 8-like, chloroplastic [Gastrolobium bilobum]
MASRFFTRKWKIRDLASVFMGEFMRTSIPNPMKTSLPFRPFVVAVLEFDSSKTVSGLRQYHDGRPRGPLWRGKKLIGKEALFVISGLKRFKDDEDKLHKFIKTHVLRLLKMDLIAVLTELERQEHVSLALMVFKVMQKQNWYEPDAFLYKDLIIALARSKKMDEVLELWESMRKENLFPDSQTYTEVIRGFLSYGSPADAMNIFEDMKNSPDPPEELPFRILLKGLLPHPLLRNKVKQDFEELFPDSSIYDPPQEIFGIR